MKFLQTLVASTGFHDPAHNPHRLEVFDRLLAVATKHGVELVVLPGGYLTVPTVQDVPGAIAELSHRADRVGVAVIGGVDVAAPSGDDPKKAARDAKRTATAALPYFGFATGRVAFGTDHGRRWQQSSSTSANAWDVPDPDVPGPDRVVGLGTTRIGVLICGELFSSRGGSRWPGCGSDWSSISGTSAWAPALPPRWKTSPGTAGVRSPTPSTWGGEGRTISSRPTVSGIRSRPTSYGMWVTTSVGSRGMRERSDSQAGLVVFGGTGGTPVPP